MAQVSPESCGASGAACTACTEGKTCGVAGTCTDGPGGQDRIAGPNAFTVASVLGVSGGVVVTDNPGSRADYCAGRPIDNFRSISVVKTSSSPIYEFPVGNGSIYGEVRYQVRMGGVDVADVPGTGTASIDYSSDGGTFIGSFDVVFRGETEHTTGIFGGRPCR